MLFHNFWSLCRCFLFVVSAIWPSCSLMLSVVCTILCILRIYIDKCVFGFETLEMIHLPSPDYSLTCLDVLGFLMLLCSPVHSFFLRMSWMDNLKPKDFSDWLISFLFNLIITCFGRLIESLCRTAAKYHFNTWNQLHVFHLLHLSWNNEFLMLRCFFHALPIQLDLLSRVEG